MGLMSEISKKRVDVSAPGKKMERGHLHPLTQVQRKAVEIFSSMGFEIAEGPEVETEYYNFDALNIPKDHPARDLWDTFWIKGRQTDNQLPTTEQKSVSGKPSSVSLLLRTHTSPVQVRYMENILNVSLTSRNLEGNLISPNRPIRIIAPGRVFRYEATDTTHEIQFYQLEGLMVEENITLANLKAVMETFFKRFFSRDIEVRLRPSYFPFVEPGVEIDMRHGGKKPGKWIEVGGAGMVHPRVLNNAKINSRQKQGFAFGMGIDRLAMLKYKIDDVRLFYSGDLRFIKQF